VFGLKQEAATLDLYAKPTAEKARARRARGLLHQPLTPRVEQVHWRCETRDQDSLSVARWHVLRD
jgi:hypothetical protein